MKVQFQLTLDHINRGKTCAANSCPLAICINEKLKPDLESFIDGKFLDIFNRKTGEIMMLSISLVSACQMFVQAFDFYGANGENAPKPFSFELDIPKEFLRNS